VHLINCPTCGSAIQRIEGARYDHDEHKLVGEGYVIEFTPTQGAIFSLLWKAYPKRRVVTRDRISDVLYSANPNGGPLTERKVVDVLLHKIRRKLLDQDADVYIHTRYGIGWMLRFRPTGAAIPMPVPAMAKMELEAAAA
jgi:DNA-binding response OmpR family regulator